MDNLAFRLLVNGPEKNKSRFLLPHDHYLPVDQPDPALKVILWFS